MTKGVRVQDVIASDDPEELKSKLVGLLQDVNDGMGMPITIYCAQLCASALERQAVLKLEASSKRLERLTWALVALTIVLALLALPPAFEGLKRFF